MFRCQPLKPKHLSQSGWPRAPATQEKGKRYAEDSHGYILTTSPRERKRHGPTRGRDARVRRIRASSGRGDGGAGGGGAPGTGWPRRGAHGAGAPAPGATAGLGRLCSARPRRRSVCRRPRVPRHGARVPTYRAPAKGYNPNSIEPAQNYGEEMAFIAAKPHPWSQRHRRLRHLNHLLRPHRC